MPEKSWCMRRRFSGFMAFVIMFIYVFNHSFLSSSRGTGIYAAEADVSTPSEAVRDRSVTLKNHPAEDVQITVMSDQTCYEAGDFLCLDLYIQNHTGQEITDGRLRYHGRGIPEDTAYFEDMSETDHPEGFWDDEAGCLKDLTLSPGETRHIQFFFNIDDKIEEMKSQKVGFVFTWRKDGTLTTSEQSFRYVTSGMNLVLPEIMDPDGTESGTVRAGETGQMVLDFDLGRVLDIIDEKQSDSDTGSTSDAQKATGSNGLPATGSNAWIKWEDDSTAAGEKPVLNSLSCQVDTYGIRLNRFHVASRDKDENYGTSTVCSFQVDEDVKPGTYYGTVTASYRLKNHEYSSTQGFAIRVVSDHDEAVAEVIRLIDELPELDEIEAAFAAFDAAGDEEGYDAYYAALYEQVMNVYRKYQALTEEQKEMVYNREKLLALEWLWGAAALELGDVYVDDWAKLVKAIEEVGPGEARTVHVNKWLIEGVLGTSTIKVKGNITLDLHGKRIRCTGNKTENLFTVCDGATFTIIDTSQNDKTPPEWTDIGSSVTEKLWEAADGIRDYSTLNSSTYTSTYRSININFIETEQEGKTSPDLRATSQPKTMDLSGIGAISSTDVKSAIYVENGGTLNIENGRITTTTSTDSAISVDGGILNMSGGYIVGNDHNSCNGGGISVINGTLNMSGGIIANNSVRKRAPLEQGSEGGTVPNTQNGGGIYLRNSDAAISGDAMIVGNLATNGGGIYAVGGSNVTITGDVKIAGNLARGGYIGKERIKGSGGGIYIAPYTSENNKNTLDITGGSITGNIAISQIEYTTPASLGGGGIFSGGDLTISGNCSVSNNFSNEGGGGILLWHKTVGNGLGHEVTTNPISPTFHMDGGTVKNNASWHSEGGGIRCEGLGTIESGVIQNNCTLTGYDFGGGGIYVETSDNTDRHGILTIFNAEITDNEAYGYGGDVAGCGKGDLNALTVNGAAIYGNTSKGENLTTHAGDEQTKVHYSEFFSELNKGKIAQDYFCVGQSTIYDYMLGGGSHNWKGACNHDSVPDQLKTDPLVLHIDYKNGERGVMGLTADIPDTSTKKNIDAVKNVIISGNISAMHGGGIGCNGVLILGDKSGNLRIEKKLVGETSDKSFRFKVELTKGGQPLEGQYTCIGSKEGTISSGGIVELKSGESAEIRFLPEGTEYTVTELDTDGYDVDVEVKETNESSASKTNGPQISGTIKADKDQVLTSTLTFTNTKKEEKPEKHYGSLSLTKVVTDGSEADRNLLFRFHVSLTDETGSPLSGSYGYTGAKTGTITGGQLDIELKHGDTVTIHDLPEGTQYVIEETNGSDYYVSVSKDHGEPVAGNKVTGQIKMDSKSLFSSAVTFTNEKPDNDLDNEHGNLSLTKIVTEGGETDRYFHFHISLTDENGSPLFGSYHYTGSKEGTITGGQLNIELKHGDTVTIHTLPVGSRYTIRETQTEGYITSPQDGVETGVITHGSHNVLYENEKLVDEPGSGHLSLRKTVTGTRGDRNRLFNFTVTLTDSSGQELTGSYNYDGSKQGTIKSGDRISLKHDESVTIRNLPEGTLYSIREWEADMDGYTTSSNGASGEIKADETAQASFINHRPGGGGGNSGDDDDDDDGPGETRPTEPVTQGQTPSETTPAGTTPAESQSTGETPPENPENPDTPVVTEFPDPNDPDSPERIIIVEDGVPRAYVKVWDPEQQTFLYIPEEDVPLFGLPKTGHTGKRTMGWILWFAILGCVGEEMVYSSRKRRKKEDDSSV